tara:strand:- start:1368 stop:2132 length:765 start_codon:yes stop_codon:yes gene_type:complete
MNIEEPSQLRELCRNNKFSKNTSGLCNNYIHTNMIILPHKYADDFKLFCDINNKPCPLIEKLNIGDPVPYKSAKYSNICTDLPKYNIYKNGNLVDISNNIINYWNDDLVVFLLGCSNSFENHLKNQNIKLKHIEDDKCVAMYKTNIDTNRTEFFKGKLVVSMRLIKEYEVENVVNITDKYPLYHGAPLHIGDYNELGIKDITKPDWGDYIKPDADEVLVFWACGVTVKNIIEESKPDFAITHEPGCMFVTDLIN